MAKLFLRDIGSHPERDLEVTLFPDGELQFEANHGNYVHININKKSVAELVAWLIAEEQGVKPNLYPCEEEGCDEPAVMFYCEDHAP